MYDSGQSMQSRLGDAILKLAGNIVKNRFVVYGIGFLTVTVFAAKFVFLMQPLASLPLYVTGDDAYYYFKIAENIAAGNGSTFDGLAPTNGYHPLWMLILIPIFMLFGDGAMFSPVHAALVASWCFDAAAAVLLYIIFRKITSSRFIASIVVFLWALTPSNFFLTNIGLETPVALFLALLFLWHMMRTAEKPSLQKALILSVIAGFMMLARTDYFFIAGAPFILWFLMRKEIRIPAFRYAAAYLIPASIMLIPWFVWNLTTFGTVVQTSGAAFSTVQYQLLEISNPTLPAWALHIKAALGDFATQIPETLELTNAGYVYPILLALLAGALFVLRNTSQKRLEPVRPVLFSLLAFTIVLGIFFVFQVGIRHAYRVWYFVPLFNTLPLLWFVYHLEGLRALMPWEVKRVQLAATGFALVALGFLAFCFFYDYWQNYRIPRPTNNECFVQAAEWINNNIPEGEAVGVLNSGIIGYLSNRRVVNLDGLVNNHAYAALAEHRLYEYATKDIELKYLVDWEGAIRYKFKASWGVPIMDHLEKMADVCTAPYSDIRAYRFKN
jgi:hypothetical protein